MVFCVEDDGVSGTSQPSTTAAKVGECFVVGVIVHKRDEMLHYADGVLRDKD